MNYKLKLPYQKEFSFHAKEIILKKEKILKALQVPSNGSDPYLDELIDNYSKIALEICTPRAAYEIYPEPKFSASSDMLVNGLNFHLEKIVSASLKKSSHLAFFVGTAGIEIERQSKQLMQEGHLLEGLIMDILGAEIAEETARLIHQKVQQEMILYSFNITNRYSPGYCNWSVSDQQKLFSLLGKNSCGIQLTESSLMIPIKSVSGIIGVGKDVIYQDYFCNRCKVESCIYRDSK